MKSEGLPSRENPDDGVARQRLIDVSKRIIAFRNEIKPELEQSLNNYLHTQAPQTATEKKALADQVNGLLAELGFAIERESQICSLYALSGAHDPHGRFRIQVRSAGKPVAWGATIDKLLPLTLNENANLSQKPSEPRDSTYRWTRLLEQTSSKEGQTR